MCLTLNARRDSERDDPVRQISNHNRTGADNGSNANAHAMNDYGAHSEPRSRAQCACAPDRRVRREVCIIANDAIVLHDGRRIYNHSAADAGVGINHTARHKDRTHPDYRRARNYGRGMDRGDKLDSGITAAFGHFASIAVTTNSESYSDPMRSRVALEPFKISYNRDTHDLCARQSIAIVDITRDLLPAGKQNIRHNFAVAARTIHEDFACAGHGCRLSCVPNIFPAFPGLVMAICCTLIPIYPPAGTAASPRHRFP